MANLKRFEACLEGEICCGRGLIYANCALPVCFIVETVMCELQDWMKQTREFPFNDCPTLLIST